MRETGLRQMPDAPHQPGVRLRRALLAVEGRLIRLEGQRLGERARGDPDSIRGAYRVALGMPLPVSSDGGVDASASAGGAPDRGAYLNG
jgi:hypothetical protein